MGGIPETLYARDGDRYLAYQVVGDHGPALMFVPPTNFPIDLLWDEPTVAGHMRRLASFSRLIPTDLLGAGSSDRIGIENLPAIQAWRDGLLAVLDATETKALRSSQSSAPRCLHCCWLRVTPIGCDR